MKIKFWNPNIKFNISFSHSSATRDQTQTLLVEISRNDKIGYGESCPREYVTGESLQSVENFILTISQEESFNSIKTLKDLINFKQNISSKIDKNLSAWGALELAVLDLLSNEANCTVEELLNLPNLQEKFQYTGVISSGKTEMVNMFLQQYCAIGISDFKLKITGEKGHDYEIIKTLINNPLVNRLRLDGNNCFKSLDELQSYFNESPEGIFAIEEPLQSKSIKEYEDFYTQSSIPVILDESLTKLSDLDKIKNHNAIIFNVRISKNGGILNSIKILEFAEKYNIPVIIGAQVGETSLLTRAALTVANAFKKQIIAQEGAYGEILLEKDPFSPVLQFGKKGLLDIKESENKNGFQLTLK